MPKMRWSKDIDWRELDNAEYSEDDFEEYDGPLPPANVILSGNVKKIWATESSNGDSMLKVLFEADGNTGDRKVYNGWGGWDNILFTMPQVKFRWQPFFDAIGISLADVKNRTVVGDEDNQGHVIERIGSVKFGGKIPARVKIKREKYEGETQARIGKWLPPADAVSDEDDFEDGDGDEDDEDDPF